MNTSTGNNHYISNRSPLLESALVRLPPGCVRAAGWLAGQLRLQAEGLTGHLDRLFDDVGPNTAWLGGDGEDWERGPYYLRGAVALAYVGRDERMLAKIRPWIEWALNSQREDGFFGPAQVTSKTKQGEGFADWWSRMIMLQVLEMHHEATGDERVIPFLSRYYDYQLAELTARPLKSWAQRRGGDNTASVHWLYNRTGDPQLLKLGELLASQTYDWTSDFLASEPIRSHVVNLSQGYKQPGIWYAQCKDQRFRDAVYAGLDNAMRFHGRADGMHSGDEAEAGLGSTRGTELCAVVEFMLSMETLLGVLGDPALADRLERATFNALPTLISADWKSHQYFCQPNQVLCTREKHNFSTDHGDDLTFGALAGYPCCATNMHMGWPMLVQHMWMATPDNGLAAVVYGPCEVTARVADGQEVTVVEETNYPFGSRITLTVRTREPVTFPLKLRIPEWCREASMRVAGKAGPAGKPGAFVAVHRTWSDGDEVVLDLPMQIKATRRENDSVAIERGPLVFALPVAEDWRKFPDWRRGDAVDDYPQWEVHPDSEWNYGLVVDPSDPSGSLEVEESGTVTDQPWTVDAAPVKLRGKARRIPGWGMGEFSNAAPPPASPVKTAEPLEAVTLLPYGATRLRIAYLPVVEK